MLVIIQKALYKPDGVWPPLLLWLRMLNHSHRDPSMEGFKGLALFFRSISKTCCLVQWPPWGVRRMVYSRQYIWEMECNGGLLWIHGKCMCFPQPSFFVCKLLATSDCSRFWKKHVKVGVAHILVKVYLIFDQLCNHWGGHHLERDWAVLGVLFLFWLQQWKKAESLKLSSIHTCSASHQLSTCTMPEGHADAYQGTPQFISSSMLLMNVPLIPRMELYGRRPLTS